MRLVWWHPLSKGFGNQVAIIISTKCKKNINKASTKLRKERILSMLLDNDSLMWILLDGDFADVQ